MGHVVIQDRDLFMQQAYTAMFTGSVFELPYEARRQVVEEVTKDLVGIVKSISPPGFEHAAAISALQHRLLAATRPN